VSYQIFLCDLPPDCTDEQLVAHLQPYGTLAALEWLPSDDGTGLRRAMATVESDAPLLGIIGQLNQQPLGEQAIVASPAQPPDTPGELSKRQIAASNEIAANLNEKARWPRMMIRQTVGACGVRFAMEMMRRAQEIDAGEGMLVPDGSRRRTVGGVFFALSRQYMTADLGRHIFHQTKETVKEQKARRKQAASAPAEEPAATPNEDAPPDPPAPDPTPEPSPEALEAARQQLDALRADMHAAQAQLEAVKSGQAPRTTGAFTLLKQVVDTQKAIDALLAEYPSLK